MAHLRVCINSICIHYARRISLQWQAISPFLCCFAFGIDLHLMFDVDRDVAKKKEEKRE